MSSFCSETITTSVGEENWKSNPHINIQKADGDLETKPEKYFTSKEAFFSK